LEEKDKEKTEFTLADLKELVGSIIESNVMSKGFVKLGDLKEQIKEELASVVSEQKDLKLALEKEIEKLANLPGPRGNVDVGKDGGEELKGLSKSGGYDSYAMFAKDVYESSKPQMRQIPPKLKKWSADVEAYEKIIQTKPGTPSLIISDPEQGGYLIPPEYSASLMERGFTNADFAPMADIIPMARNTVHIPFIKDFTHTTYLYGAMMAYWLDELGTKLPTKPKFGKTTLELNKLVVLCYSSDELLEDSPISMEPLLTKKSGNVIKWKVDEAMLAGTGVGQPLGVLNCPALIPVNKQAGQAAATIVWQNIADMWSRLHPASIPNAVWVANNSIFSQLMGMAMAVGTGGAPVYLPANGFSAKPFDTLMGKRIIWSEHSPILGQQGDIALIDWTQYMVGQKRGAGAGIKTASSIHLMFLYDQTAFRFVFRMDGQPWWPTVFTPKNGNTQSPFITLKKRE